MSNDGVNTGRRRFLAAATTVVGAAGVVGVAVPFVGSWEPSAKAKAAGAPVKIDIGKVEPGQMIVGEWRGKPIYIVRRTPEALEAVKKMDGFVSDPNSEMPQQPPYAQNEYRSIKPEYLIAIGICTHLGCAPKYMPEVGSVPLEGGTWLGGFYCPCHGSKYDLAGRVMKAMPAPFNLQIPPYSYESASVIVVGVDQEKA